MAQIFHPLFNPFARASVFGGILIVAVAVWVSGILYRSPYVTGEGVVRDQPVPFSHEHHVSGLGIDCRYCHTSVEESSFAGIPSTKTCMNCHSQIWSDSPMLEPVRRSLKDGTPLTWLRVHRVPDYVYFDHSIHVAKGIGCASCHGRVDRMPLLSQQETLYMEWCLDCHRHPEREVRPRAQLFNLGWTPDAEERTLGTKLAKDYGIQTRTDCVDCHR
jgi:hypothetical protein